jgi:hypothetical protein
MRSVRAVVVSAVARHKQVERRTCFEAEEMVSAEGIEPSTY